MILGVLLRKKREELGLTLKDVSEKTGMTLSNLTNIELGKHRNTKYNNLVELEKVLDIDLSAYKNLRIKRAGIEQTPATEDAVIFESNAEIIPNKPHPLPVYYVWAGEPSPAFYEIPSQNIADLGVLAIGFDFIIKIRGNSMTEKDLFDGDTCLGKRVQFPSQLQDGNIVAIIMGEYTMLKSFHKNNGEWLLEWKDGSEKRMKFTEDMQILGVIKRKLSVKNIF